MPWLSKPGVVAFTAAPNRSRPSPSIPKRLIKPGTFGRRRHGQRAGDLHRGAASVDLPDR